MSRFFAVLLFLLSAVVCQAAPTGDQHLNPEVQSEKHPLALVPATEASPPYSSPSPSSPQSPLLPPFTQPDQTPQQPTPQTLQSPIKTPPTPLPRTFQSSLQGIPQTPQCPPETPLCPLPQPHQPPPQPTPETPKCPPEVPPCPPECQPEPPVSEPQQPPKKKTGWRNGLMNLVNVCLNKVFGGLTNLIVITGEKPAKKPRNSKFILSFEKRKHQHSSKQPTDSNDSDEEDIRASNVSCFWYKDYRTRAPRTRIASCVTDSEGGRQCNFCCVGERVIDCSNCLTINCKPQINCCSCTVNITVVNNP